ncbi:MAG: argininosuccinate lyase, partial [Rhizobiaceae bacterium]|nr:argininosuccinate lyase [Rhizobiaceae bacterium]
VRVAGLPFREAHHVSGRAVALAEQTRRSLDRLTLDEYREINPAITDEVFSVLTVASSVKSRTSYGGTAPSEVKRQIRYWRKRLKRGARPANLR